jgi:hypothetical protein
MMTRCILTLGSLAILGGCGSTATLKPPASVGSAQELKVEGHSGSIKTFRDKDLKIGSYAVTNIDRDWDKGSSTSAGPWSRNAKSKAYRFDLKAEGHTLHGECTEQAVEQAVAGFGKAKVTFGCTCGEGDAQQAKLELVNGAGSAQLAAGAAYDLRALHESAQGAQVSSALGYEFRGAKESGAVDVSGAGRAWIPASVSDQERLALVCSYAGLLLYRPTK